MSRRGLKQNLFFGGFAAVLIFSAGLNCAWPGGPDCVISLGRLDGVTELSYHKCSATRVNLAAPPGSKGAIKSVSFQPGFKNLRALNLSGQHVSGLEQIQMGENPIPEEIILNDNPLADWSGWAHRRKNKVKKLHLAGVRLRDLDSLAGFHRLEYLVVRLRERGSWKQLSRFPRLRMLSVEAPGWSAGFQTGKTMVGSGDATFGRELRFLRLAFPPGKNSAGPGTGEIWSGNYANGGPPRWPSFPELRVLILTGARLTGLDLRSSTRLESVYLGRNLLAGWERLLLPPSVKRLDIRRNKLKDLQGIEAVGQLVELILAENKIVNISEVELLSGLEFLDLQGNPVKTVRVIERLRGRGVDVLYP